MKSGKLPDLGVARSVSAMLTLQGQPEDVVMGLGKGLLAGDQLVLAETLVRLGDASLRGRDALQTACFEVIRAEAENVGMSEADYRAELGAKIGELLDRASLEQPMSSGASQTLSEQRPAILRKLAETVGFKNVKKFVIDFLTSATADDMRRQLGISVAPTPPRPVIVIGKKGTGKQTAVDLVRDLYVASNRCGKVVHTVPASSLMGTFVGWAQQEVRKAFDAANGGVLIIRNAGDLLGDTEFERQARAAINQEMTARRGKVTVMMTAHPDDLAPLRERIPGLAESTQVIHCEEFSNDQLHTLFLRELATAGCAQISEDAKTKALRVISGTHRGGDFGNAHFARSMALKCKENLDGRIVGLGLARAREGMTVTPDDVTPPSGRRVTGDEGAQFKTVDAFVKAMDVDVIGQDEAKRALATARVNQSNRAVQTRISKKPVGVHFVAGPSGCGKTWTAKILATLGYQDDDQRALGLPPPLFTVAGTDLHNRNEVIQQLTRGKGSMCEWVRRNSTGVVLIDEADKADDALWDALQQIADEGQMPDADGRIVDFSGIQFVLATNLGNKTDEGDIYSDVVTDKASPLYGRYRDREEVRAKATELLRGRVRKEFYHRLTGHVLPDGTIEKVILFDPLTIEEQRKIFDKSFDDAVRSDIRGRGFDINVTDEAIGWLLKRAASSEGGNRVLEDTLNLHVFSPANERLNGESAVKGTVVHIDVSGDALAFDLRAPASETETQKEVDAPPPQDFDGDSERLANQVIDGLADRRIEALRKGIRSPQAGDLAANVAEMLVGMRHRLSDTLPDDLKAMLDAALPFTEMVARSEPAVVYLIAKLFQGAAKGRINTVNQFGTDLEALLKPLPKVDAQAIRTSVRRGIRVMAGLIQNRLDDILTRPTEEDLRLVFRAMSHLEKRGVGVAIEQVGKALAKQTEAMLGVLPYFAKAEGSEREAIREAFFQTGTNQDLMNALLRTIQERRDADKLFESVAGVFETCVDRNPRFATFATHCLYNALHRSLLREFNTRSNGTTSLVNRIRERTEKSGAHAVGPGELKPNEVSVKWTPDGALEITREKIPPRGTLVIGRVDHHGEPLRTLMIYMTPGATGGKIEYKEKLGFNDTAGLTFKPLLVAPISPLSRKEATIGVTAYKIDDVVELDEA